MHARMQANLKHYTLVVELYCMGLGMATTDARTFLQWAEKRNVVKHFSKQAGLLWNQICLKLGGSCRCDRQGTCWVRCFVSLHRGRACDSRAHQGHVSPLKFARICVCSYIHAGAVQSCVCKCM